MSPLRKWVFGMSLDGLDFARWGFNSTGEARLRLEQVAMTVVEGYNAAVEHGLGRSLSERSAMVKTELSGFFHEGLAMGLFTLDRFMPGSSYRIKRFLEGTGRYHDYMSYIGIGLAVGLFRLNPARHVKPLDPLSGPLLYDGYGFYHAYFHSKKFLKKHVIPSNVASNPFLRDRFDAGMGRALWFYAAGDPRKVEEVIRGFAVERRGALWAGVGLAATYACGVSNQTLEDLLHRAEGHENRLAQGSILASHARHRAGNPHEDDRASLILTGMSSEEVHGASEEFARDLQGRGVKEGKPALQVWLDRLLNWIAESARVGEGVIR
jgi:hypothetical protein